jgi:hypothetical protein
MSISQAYIDFLKRKIPQAEVAGFEPQSDAHESLFPHQVDICRWAILGGRRAVFANFGLGKTRIHLQIAKWVRLRKRVDGTLSLPLWACGRSSPFLTVPPWGCKFSMSGTMRR